MPEVEQQDVWLQIGVQEGINRYKQIRKRLRNPPNAVKDEGIDLTRANPTPQKPPPPPEESKESQIQKRIDTILSLYPPVERKLSIGAIFKSTAMAFGITLDEIKGRSRRSIYAHPRQVGMYLTRRLLGFSYPIIGTYLDLDHTTVIHATKRVEIRAESDPELAATINDIEQDLLSRYANHHNAGLAVSAEHEPSVEEWQTQRQDNRLRFERLQTVDISGGPAFSSAEEVTQQDVVGAVQDDTTSSTSIE